MHHMRKLASLNKKGKREQPLWMKIMITRKRKSIPLAESVTWIYTTIGQSQREKETGEPYAAKVSRTGAPRGAILQWYQPIFS